MNMRTGLGGLAAAVGATALLITGTSTTAHAAGGPSGGVWRLQNAQTGLCLTGTGSGATRIFTSACSSSNARQHWAYSRVGNKVRLENTGTGRCLKPTNAFSQELTSAPCGIDDNDLWGEEFIASKVRLISGGGNAVDSDAKGNAYLKQYGPDNPYQQWYLTTTIPGR
ncbi:RICIN domain-containing protein [Streptomyces subrutilus]|nr:RICIN domain-containing protein [Streptomyces subrutilus]WSJ31648.1 RICIN domain-containing protein [Streptomyces subrutilus]GGZ52340.1 hypothetical protein GCM10010371_09740 [Streptomyces subrutilus]